VRPNPVMAWAKDSLASLHTAGKPCSVRRDAPVMPLEDAHFGGFFVLVVKGLRQIPGPKLRLVLALQGQFAYHLPQQNPPRLCSSEYPQTGGLLVFGV